MYRGFNIINVLFRNDNGIFIDGESIVNDYKELIASKIDSFVLNNGKIDGIKMQSTWFPKINADVFISHSHQDERLAIALAGWLKSRFGLNAFIDSCVWGYSNDLLKQIDEEHCKTGDSLYSYDSRNYSTSHVHMMLASALTMMIDKTETLFFLNTPQSLSADDIKKKTMSPWIYYELTTSRYIRKPKPSRLIPHALNEDFKLIKKAAPNIEYTVDFTDFITLDGNKLKEWSECTESQGVRALDELYSLHPID